MYILTISYFLSTSHIFLFIETVYIIKHDILLLYQPVQTPHYSYPGEGDHGPGPEGRVPAGGCGQEWQHLQDGQSHRVLISNLISLIQEAKMAAKLLMKRFAIKDVRFVTFSLKSKLLS